jgi:pimeloyl-ACP methyl ester carboxylesterase
VRLLASARRLVPTRVPVVRTAVGVLALLVMIGGDPGVGASDTASAGGTILVGTQTLTLCGSGPTAYCGTLGVPLDYADPSGPQISIAFRWYPATANGTPEGTVLPVEGGPGFPSIGSVKGGYSRMYGPLLAHWNMLAVDLRGTGASTPVRCPALQDFSGQASGPAFDVVVGACADSLNHRWKAANGSWVRASDFFTSAAAAEDVAAVIHSLGIGKVDLYGDSYGSFFAQVFTARYPQLVRSLVLDSTYAVLGLDPWYRSTIDAMPADFDVVCDRSPACAQAAPGSSWARISLLAARLRAAPISGTVPGPTGALVSLSMNVVGLVDLVNDAAGDPLIYRGLDASARALLDENDPYPLLRLYAQRLAFDEDYFGVPASEYSGGLYFAVSCLDYPQLFDMNASSSVRALELASAEDDLNPATFAPFTVEEWISQDQNTEAYTACLSWPSPTNAQPPVTRPPPLLPPAMPVLILGGELDTWTPPSGVAQVQAEIGGHSRFIELANATHVVGEGDTMCGSQLVRAFVADPADLDSLDASCAATVPAVRAVGVYADQLNMVPPLAPSSGCTATAAALRVAAAVVDTAGDALARMDAIDGTLDHGLYGGTVREGAGDTLALDQDQLVPGVAVSGRLTLEAGVASGRMVASSPGGLAKLEVSWPLGGNDALAQVGGRVGNQSVVGQLPAP